MAKPNRTVGKKEVEKAAPKAVEPMKQAEQTTALATSAPEGNWGTERMNKRNVLISRIQLCQALSDVVAKEELFSSGDLIDSVAKEMLAEQGEGLEIIPFYTFDNWLVRRYNEETEEYDFDRVEDMTPANIGWKYEDEEDGVPVQRDHQINFYVMVKSRVEESEAAWPLLITFKRTSRKAGRQLVSKITQLQGLGQNIASRVYTLSTKKEQNKDGKPYYALEVKETGKSSAKMQSIAFNWYTTMFKEKSVDVVVADDVEEGVEPSGPTRKAGEVRGDDAY